MADGLETVSLEEAFAAALSESGAATPPDSDGSMPEPSVRAQPSAMAPGDTAEQPTDTEPLSPEDELARLMLEEPDPDQGDLEDGAENADTPSLTPGTDEFWNFKVMVETVDGPQAVTIKDLQGGFMRRADYTQKTQAVAAERKRLERSEALMTELEKDPVEFTRKLMVQLNLGDGYDIELADIPDYAKIDSPEEYEKRIGSEVEQRVAEHPAVVEAKAITARAEIDKEFDRIGSKHNVTLPRELRDSLIAEAIQRGTSDLEFIVEARLAKAKARQMRVAERADGAPRRPQGNKGSSMPESQTVTINSIEDAWEAARLEQSQANI